MKHLIPRHHKDLMRSMWDWEHDFWDRFFSESTPGKALKTWERFPATDIQEKDDKYVITADVSGVDAKDIEISMDEGKDFLRVERSSGSFHRRFHLSDVDAEHITAKYKDGVLMVDAPKLAKKETKKIKIES